MNYNPANYPWATVKYWSVCIHLSILFGSIYIIIVCLFIFLESTAMCSCVRSSRALSPVLLPRLRLVPHMGYRPAGRGLWTSPHLMAVNGDSNLLPLPSQARVVICGGGIVGSSVAYHLAKLGWTDIVLLEQGR